MTKQSYNEIDFYNYYTEYVDNDLYRIEKSLYKEIIFEFFKHIRDTFIEQGRSIKLPCRVGRLQIIKKKPKNWLTSPKAIDYKTSKELNHIVYHLNDHSNGFKFRLYWDKQDCNIPNKHKFQMKLCRDNKRHLAYLIKSKIQDYQEI
jgi:hypothetical protein